MLVPALWYMVSSALFGRRRWSASGELTRIRPSKKKGAGFLVRSVESRLHKEACAKTAQKETAAHNASNAKPLRPELGWELSQPEHDDSNAELVRHWLRIERDSNDPRCKRRRFSRWGMESTQIPGLQWYSLHVAWRVIRLRGEALVRLVTRGMEIEMAVMFALDLLQSVAKPYERYATARMMNLIQKTYQSETTDRFEAVWIIAVKLVMGQAHNILGFFQRRCTTRCEDHVKRELWVPVQFVEAFIPNYARQSTLVTHLLHQGTHVAKQGGFHRLYGSFVTIPKLLVAILAELYLLIRVIRSAGQTAPFFSLPTLWRFLFSISPIVLRRLTDWYRGRRSHYYTMSYEGTEEYEQMSMGNTTDIWMNQIKPWLRRQSQIHNDRESRKRLRPLGWVHFRNLGLDFVEELFEQAFQVLLAARILKIRMSLGDISMYEGVLEDLIEDCEDFKDAVEQAWGSIHHYIAYFLSVQLDHEPLWLKALLRVESEAEEFDVALGAVSKVPQGVSYDSVRSDKGMKIEAKNLSFAYTRGGKKTLHDINLTVEPGQTLALVGFNGSGKTTLAKVMMGVYGKPTGGELLVNGQNIQAYNHNTLLDRIACLSQEFLRAMCTLRNNVRIGDIQASDKDIQRAILAGGAKDVQNLVGLDGVLLSEPLSRTGRNMGCDSREVHSILKKTRGDCNTKATPGDPSPSDNAIAALPAPAPVNAIVESSLHNVHADAKGPSSNSLSDKVEIANGSADDDNSAESDGSYTGDDNETSDDGDTSDDSDSCLSTDEGDDAWNPYLFNEKPPPRPAPKGISGGQWQRVALARTFLRSEKADLVVFDEPSAALDPRAEADLFGRIHALSSHGGRQRTTIYITHRFCTVRKADKIAFMKEGRIIEYGNHAELMELGGQYCELFNLQKSAFEED